MKKWNRLALGALIVIAVALGYNNCSNVTLNPNPQTNETNTGNPFNPTQSSSVILNAVCNVLNRCSNVAPGICTTGVLGTSGVGPTIGLPTYVGPYSTIEAAESSSIVSGKPVATNNCVTAITALSCSSPVVKAAYNPSASNPFAQVPGMIPTSVNTCPITMSPTSLAANLVGLYHLNEGGGSTTFADYFRKWFDRFLLWLNLPISWCRWRI